MKDKPLILITNDDSVKAPGIRALISFMRPYGKIVVVAPDRSQSGTAHAVTIAHPLRLEQIAKEDDYEEYSCALAGVPSVGFSLGNYSHQADFQPGARFIKEIAEKVMANGLPDGVCLNVNIPDLPENRILGIKVCRQSEGTWQEDFDEREDPHGEKYYWMKGVFVKIGDGEDTDQWALENGFVSVVPVQFDLTATHALSILKAWF